MIHRKALLLMSLCLIHFTLSGCAQLTKKERKKMDAIITEYTEAVKLSDPFYAPYFNIEDKLSEFGDYLSPKYFKQSIQIRKTALQKLQTVDTKDFRQKDHLLYQLFKQDLETSLDYFQYDFHYLESFHQMGNRLREYLDDSSPSLASFPFQTPKHYYDFVKRSEGFIPFIDQQIEILNEGLKKGYALNCTVARNATKTYADGLTKVVENHPFYRPLQNFPKGFSDSDKRKIRIEFNRMITENIQPGFQKFDDYYKKTYLPKCRRTFGLHALPKGSAMYSHKIRHHTDLNLDAVTIHELGLKEVARIRADFQTLMTRMNFKGSYKDFMRSLVTDPRYYFKTSQDMFAAFQKYRGFVDKKIPNYFKLMPKSDFRLVESENPEEAAASYRMPTDFTPYGRFVVNTKNIKATPTYGVQTLYLHEAIPGHHFQLALQYELRKELTEYQRKLYFSTAFIEGWALYAEQLGREEGWITDDLQMIGSLSDEMLRAVRLVVDTGIHHYGWTRTQAIQYMQNNLASDRRDIEIEVDRYSVMPGQALSYKLGQLKIIELRELAKQKLKGKFDIREFHTVVLQNGTLSLSTLETAVNNWIESQLR